MWRMIITAFFGYLLVGHGYAVAGDDAEAILDKLQKRYDTIRDAVITFKHDMQFAVTKNEQSFSGKLWMKKGNKYRLEMEEQIIVTDGISMWSFNKTNNQVFIDKYKEDPKSFSPDKVLTRLPETYTSTLMGKEKIGEQELTIVKLIPKVKNSSVKWMKVWIDTNEWRMQKVQVFDMSENLATYNINDVKINAGIPEAQFTFTIPVNVEVIDLR